MVKLVSHAPKDHIAGKFSQVWWVWWVLLLSCIFNRMQLTCYHNFPSFANGCNT